MSKHVVFTHQALFKHPQPSKVLVHFSKLPPPLCRRHKWMTSNHNCFIESIVLTRSSPSFTKKFQTLDRFSAKHFRKYFSRIHIVHSPFVKAFNRNTSLLFPTCPSDCFQFQREYWWEYCYPTQIELLINLSKWDSMLK